MKSQITTAHENRQNTNKSFNTELIDGTLTLLSQLLGQQAALDFVRNPDMLLEGEVE